MYVLRQMVEKILEVQGSMALGWMGVPQAEVRMVEGMYEKTTARVVVG